jgi:DMSO/TMAO reductase YedYZ molybdopterin-dependent catalytic subunit
MAAARLADRYGLLPPDGSGVYGPGETLTYAAQRLLARNSMAREFPRSEISKVPFANGEPPKSAEFQGLQAKAQTDWRLNVDGMVERPAQLSLADLKAYPERNQITHLACEEGWSYIAEWTGVPLALVLDAAGVKPGARFVVYFSVQKDWWDSVDMDEARHPQTLVAYGLNGAELPVNLGGPLRMRVPRQLGYKNVKYITRLTVTDDLKKFGKGLGSASPEGGYAWYAGI